MMPPGILSCAETNPMPAKWVMDQIGLLRSGRARPPLAPLGDAAQARVRALLAPARTSTCQMP
jgi:4-hydroxy-tetrahydrodipicolinate synthase